MALMKMQVRQFDGIIWTVRVDPLAQTLGLQVRKAEEKRAWFYLLDLETGVVGPAICLENPWMTALLAVQGNALLVGRYGETSLPVITDEVAIDGWSSDLLEDFHPWEMEDQQLIRSPDSVDTLGLEFFPAVVPSSHVASLEFGNISMHAWHGSGTSGIELWLEVLEGKDILLRLKLEENMQKLNPAPFFMAGEWLIMIRNRNELCWLQMRT